MPTPGWNTNASSRPSASAIVVTHLEVDQRLDADTADALQVAGAGDAVHDDAEHQHRDDHLDQLDEGVAERLELDRRLRPDEADDDADGERQQHLAEQGTQEAGHRRSPGKTQAFATPRLPTMLAYKQCRQRLDPGHAGLPATLPPVRSKLNFDSAQRCAPRAQRGCRAAGAARWPAVVPCRNGAAAGQLHAGELQAHLGHRLWMRRCAVRDRRDLRTRRAVGIALAPELEHR